MGRALEEEVHLVLVVDDDAEVLETTAELIERLGYQVITAGDGFAALAILRDNEPVEILFSDLRMPGMDGERLAATARALRPGLRVVLTSGGDRPRQASDFLAKPYRTADLIRVLARQAA